MYYGFSSFVFVSLIRISSTDLRSHIIIAILPLQPLIDLLVLITYGKENSEEAYLSSQKAL